MPNSLANPTTLSHSSMRATALALKSSVNLRLFSLIFRDTHSPFAARPTLTRVSILGSTPRRPTLRYLWKGSLSPPCGLGKLRSENLTGLLAGQLLARVGNGKISVIIVIGSEASGNSGAGGPIGS